MVLASTTFIVAGIVCLAVAVSMVRRLRLREGKPASPWMATDRRETAAALGIVTLLVFGIALLAKGMFA
jgi:hypothetical protein